MKYITLLLLLSASITAHASIELIVDGSFCQAQSKTIPKHVQFNLPLCRQLSKHFRTDFTEKDMIIVAGCMKALTRISTVTNPIPLWMDDLIRDFERRCLQSM